MTGRVLMATPTLLRTIVSKAFITKSLVELLFPFPSGFFQLSFERFKAQFYLIYLQLVFRRRDFQELFVGLERLLEIAELVETDAEQKQRDCSFLLIGLMIEDPQIF